MNAQQVTKSKAPEHTVTFDKANRAIMIDGHYAGYVDGSDTMDYRAEVDEHGLKVIVTEIIKMTPPLKKDDGTVVEEIRCPLIILRPALFFPGRKENIQAIEEATWGKAPRRVDD